MFWEKGIIKWWNSLQLTLKAALITSTVSILVCIPTFINSRSSLKKADKANEIAQSAVDFTQKEFLTKYTPDLRAYISSWNIYVGDGKQYGRDDNIIFIPLVVCNKSYGLAKDIELKILFNDGADKDKDKDKDKELGLILPVLKGGATIKLDPFVPSVLSNSSEIYSSGSKKFKMKCFLEWKDASGKEYKSVELFELVRTEAYSDSPSRFIFKSKGYYNTVYSSDKYSENSAFKIDF